MLWILRLVWLYTLPAESRGLLRCTTMGFYILFWELNICNRETKQLLLSFYALRFFIKSNVFNKNIVRSYPCSESQEELSFLICIQKFWYNFWNSADELLHHPVVLHVSPLDHLPHGCRHQAQRRYEEAERRQQKRRLWKIFCNVKIITEVHFEICLKLNQIY